MYSGSTTGCPSMQLLKISKEKKKNSGKASNGNTAVNEKKTVRN